MQLTKNLAENPDEEILELKDTIFKKSSTLCMKTAYQARMQT